MSPLSTRVVALAALFIVLGAVSYAIYEKEEIIRSGEVVYLELAPIDPRSLMQGDYMALRFQLAVEIEGARSSGSLDPSLRSVPLALDSRRVATLGTASAQALRIGFRVRAYEQIWLGTNAYFFAEGTAERYTDARYGEFRLSGDTGEAVLVALCDAELNRL
jgi:uncharacterized membrane-anchored protein